jgi:hypothetical protein
MGGNKNNKIPIFIKFKLLMKNEKLKIQNINIISKFVYSVVIVDCQDVTQYAKHQQSPFGSILKNQFQLFSTDSFSDNVFMAVQNINYRCAINIVQIMKIRCDAARTVYVYPF